MRLRIATLLGVVFALAVIGTATATPASAASSMLYGTCNITAVQPWIVDNVSYIAGAATISCGSTTTIPYTVYLGVGDTFDRGYIKDSRTKTVTGGTSVTVRTDSVDQSKVMYATPGADYASRITFMGYTLTSNLYTLHGAIPYLYW